MNVKEFVRKTIEEITLGVYEAQNSCSNQARVGATRPSCQTREPAGSLREIEFDIAVVVSESSKSGVDASIAVYGIGIGGGKQKDARTETTHRIKFSVPVIYLPIREA
jgi:hypothetical protein